MVKLCRSRSYPSRVPLRDFDTSIFSTSGRNERAARGVTKGKSSKKNDVYTRSPGRLKTRRSVRHKLRQPPALFPSQNAWTIFCTSTLFPRLCAKLLHYLHNVFDAQVAREVRFNLHIPMWPLSIRIQPYSRYTAPVIISSRSSRTSESGVDTALPS